MSENKMNNTKWINTKKTLMAIVGGGLCGGCAATFAGVASVATFSLSGTVAFVGAIALSVATFSITSNIAHNNDKSKTTWGAFVLAALGTAGIISFHLAYQGTPKIQKTDSTALKLSALGCQKDNFTTLDNVVTYKSCRPS